MFLFQTLTGFFNNMIAILLISYFVINIVLIEYYELVLRFQPHPRAVQVLVFGHSLCHIADQLHYTTVTLAQ